MIALIPFCFDVEVVIIFYIIISPLINELDWKVTTNTIFSLMQRKRDLSRTVENKHDICWSWIDLRFRCCRETRYFLVIKKPLVFVARWRTFSKHYSKNDQVDVNSIRLIIHQMIALLSSNWLLCSRIINDCFISHSVLKVKMLIPDADSIK